MRKLLTALASVFAAALAPSALAQTVFSADFDSGLPPEISAPGATLTGVQGYAGLGPTGRRFEGSFLRYDSTQIHPTTLTLTNLPPHTHVSVQHLLAVIDSWDGTELLQVHVDGQLVFSHWFELALSNTSSYNAPPFGLLGSGAPLGFSAGFYYDHDQAYDLGVESAFLAVPHTASTVTIEWTLSAVTGTAAGNWQGGTDESWAIDALSVTVHNSPPGTIGTNYCTPAVPNSTGTPATISALGVPLAYANALTLRVSALPLQSFGYFILSRTQAHTPNPGGSQGTLCLGGAIGRFNGPGQIKNSGTTGTFELVPDLTHMPTPTGFVPTLPNGTWNFQAWYRDSLGGLAVSNFTDAVSVTFL